MITTSLWLDDEERALVAANRALYEAERKRLLNDAAARRQRFWDTVTVVGAVLGYVTVCVILYALTGRHSP